MARAYYNNGSSFVEMTPDLVGAAAASHTQPWSTITDTPSLLSAGEYNSETLEQLLGKVQGIAPKMGSTNITKETRITNNTWWNFLYIPHRTGIGGDNMNYGTLLLFPMTSNDWSYVIRSSANKSVSSIEKFYSSNHKPTKSDIGLGNVDNTADADKSVKYATNSNWANGSSYANKVYAGTNSGNFLYDSGNDSVNGPGGSLNNIVINSWYGVSFTSNCKNGTYGGQNKTAVGIDCRNGIVKAAKFDGPATQALNEYNVIASSTAPTDSRCKIWIKN